MAKAVLDAVRYLVDVKISRMLFTFFRFVTLDNLCRYSRAQSVEYLYMDSVKIWIFFSSKCRHSSDIDRSLR